MPTPETVFDPLQAAYNASYGFGLHVWVRVSGLPLVLLEVVLKQLKAFLKAPAAGTFIIRSFYLICNYLIHFVIYIRELRCRSLLSFSANVISGS